MNEWINSRIQLPYPDIFTFDSRIFRKEVLGIKQKKLAELMGIKIWTLKKWDQNVVLQHPRSSKFRLLWEAWLACEYERLNPGFDIGISRKVNDFLLETKFRSERFVVID